MSKKYRCGHCGYEGYCYGIGHAKGVSAPFCYRCGMNDKLTPIETGKKLITIGNRRIE